MPVMRLFRTPFVPNAEQKRQFWAVYHGMVRGLTEEDEIALARTTARIVNAQPGSVIKQEQQLERNSKFSAKFHVMLGVGFDAWEPEADRTKRNFEGRPIEKNREQFRKEVTIAAGFYTIHYAINGEIRREAMSISFANMDDVEFEQVYSAVANVLLRDVLIRYEGRADLDRVVDELLAFT